MWFLKKRNYDKILDDMNRSLRNSFSNIQKDMGLITNKHKEHDIKHEKHLKEINELKTKILLLEKKFDDFFSIPNDILSEEQPVGSKIKNDFKVREELTDSQFEFLKKLAMISTISKKEWISMQALAKEVYPSKEYYSIRSLLSNYTDILLDFGLIEKKRKGRKAIIAITDKGKGILPENFYKQIKVKTKKN